VIAPDDTGFASIDAFAISNSAELRTSSRTGALVLIFTVSLPAKVSLPMSGTIRTEYSTGTTCLGNFPGVLLKA